MDRIPLAPRDAEDTRTGTGVAPTPEGRITLESPKVRAGGEPSKAQTGTDTALYYLEAVLTGAGEGVVAIPDFLLNRAIDLGVMTGAIDPNIDRDLLSRTFYSRQYQKQGKTSLGTSYGEGEYVDFQEAGPRIAKAVGAGAAAALPVVGVGARANQVISGGRAMTPTQLGLASREASARAGEGTLKATGRDIATGLGQQYAKSPTGMLATEAALGAGAGAVTEGADIVVPGSGAYVAAAPAVAVAGIPLVFKSLVNLSPTAKVVTWASQQPEVQGVAANLKYRAKDALSSITGGNKRALSATQKKIMAELMRPDAQAEMQKAAEIQKRIKEVTDMELDLNLVERSMSPNLGVEAARIESRMTGDKAAENLARKRQNLETLLKFREGVFDEGDAAPSAVIDAATGRIDAVQTRTGKQLDDINTSLAGMADPTTGVVPLMQPGEAIEKGMSIRQQLMNKRKAAELTADKMAKKLRINDANPIGDAAVLQQQVRTDLNIAEEDISNTLIHPIVRRFLDFDFAAKGKQGKIAFQDWKNLRQAVGEAKFSATPSEQRQLAILQENLDGLMFKGAKTADSYREFGQWYKNNVILPFEDAAVIKVMKLGPGSRPKDDTYNFVMPNEHVSKTFLKDSGTATTYMKLFGGDAEKMGAIRDTVFDEVAQSAVRNGRIDPTRLQNYLNKNREVLNKLLVPDTATNEFRSVYDILSDTRTATQGLLARESTLRAREAVINKYALNKVLSKVSGMGGNFGPDMRLEQVIETGLKDPKILYQLARAARGAKDPNVDKAFKRAVVDRILTPKDIDSPESFTNFLGKNESTLRMALGEKHFSDLVVLNDALRRVLATGIKPGGGINRDDFVSKLANVTGISPESASARIVAINEGRASYRTTFVWFASQALRANQSAAMDRAFEKAIFDGEWAADLTEVAPKAAEVTVPQAKRIAEKLFYYGIQDPSAEPTNNVMTIDIPGGDLPVAPAEPPPELPVAPPPPPIGQQGALQPPAAPATMPPRNMASAMPPQPPMPPNEKGIAGTRYAALFPGDTLGAMAASGGIASLQG
jgi:hypothetical protein